MNRASLQDVAIKEERLLLWLEANGYDAAVLGRSDNFAWLTGGGENRVILTSDVGFSWIVFTKGRKHLVALAADAGKVLTEELEGLDYEPEVLPWYGKSKENRVCELVEGMRVLSDIQLPGMDCRPEVFIGLHEPLTEDDMTKLRQLGRMTEEIIFEAANRVRSGMTEYQVQGLLAGLYAEQDITLSVLLVGSDNRILEYRHCLPSGKIIDKVLLISPAVRKWGLHANVSRMVCFGEIPAETQRRYEAVRHIETEVISMSTPGTRFSDILARQKELYCEYGFPDEWQQHFQGGVTGYVVSEPARCLDSSKVLEADQAYDWFITIAGAKGEELTLNQNGQISVPSVNGIWPTTSYRKNGLCVCLPDILQR